MRVIERSPKLTFLRKRGGDEPSSEAVDYNRPSIDLTRVSFGSAWSRSSLLVASASVCLSVIGRGW